MLNTFPSEDAYGVRKRLQFITNIIDQYRPDRVLDIGCGSGNQVTKPLAMHYPHISFVGVDNDADSLNFAKEHHALPNISFVSDRNFDRNEKFNLIIASEVLEHIQDPKSFLLGLRNQLSENGKLIVTIPNGYGPFEWLTFLETLLNLSGVLIILRKIKRALFGTIMAPGQEKMCNTLAISPHINFFSYKRIIFLFSTAGLKVNCYRPRTFLCGFGIDHLIMRERHLLDWNCKAADLLPPSFVSDWMFVLEKNVIKKNGTAYQRSAYARFRYYLNKKI